MKVKRVVSSIWVSYVCANKIELKFDICFNIYIYLNFFVYFGELLSC